MNKVKEENKRKKRFFIFLILAIVICVLIAQSTFAWFVNSRKKANRFTTGEIKHEILENFVTTGKTADLLPNTTINKDVFIHNTSKSDALLRAKVTPVWVDSQGKTTDATKEIELIYPADLFTNWTKGTDGYYYYNFILQKHANNTNHATEGTIPSNINDSAKCYSKQLLDAIKLKSTVTDQSKFANTTLDVIIESDVIQVDLEGAKSEWKFEGDKTILDLITRLVTTYPTK